MTPFQQWIVDFFIIVKSIAFMPAVAGLFGAIFSLRFSPGKTFLERTWNVLSAWACAVYFTDSVVNYFSLDTVPNSQHGVAFFIGMFSLNLMAMFVGWIKSGKALKAITDVLPGGDK